MTALPTAAKRWRWPGLGGKAESSVKLVQTLMAVAQGRFDMALLKSFMKCVGAAALAPVEASSDPLGPQAEIALQPVCE